MWTVGSTLNEFQLLKKLGKGRFGEVWLAENQVAVGRDPHHVALKIPFQEEESLLSEGENLALLEHPNIVRFYRPGRNGNVVFLVMEYMSGGDLAARLKERGPLTEEAATTVTVQILRALEYLHGKSGGVHRDVKPHNILFDASGAAKLADFGLARFMEGRSTVAWIAGTPFYWAPEVYRSKVYPASDLWSLAVVLHEMLTLNRPFEAATDAELMRKMLHEPPALSPWLSPGMKQIILKALEKDPARRYPSASAMRAALEDLQAGRPVTEEVSTVTRAPLPLGVDIEFVPIPPGGFDMGSENRDSDERPVHRVRVSKAFELGKYPVTQEQWEAGMGSNPSYFKGPDRPVETVSWNDVQEFLKKLNRRGDGHLYRLPTEAEWEYAARAGTTGDSPAELDAVAWYHGNSRAQTHPVGQKQPNAWGLYDMLGNVWEWCRDWYSPDYYRNSPTVDPPGPPSGSQRVLRGGSSYYNASYLRAATRFRGEPGDRSINLGFRCVREVIP